ncbi:maleylpyruvate isomerase N-terminal domain-containing protein [Kribbella sp. NPDC056345]|uniref:maleylpyruvate isomerase N-terminal domain-containing protein n=1 Tax=Kribbella sp. NPDC056345 TaxID=3345789 RepID=UPI0035DDCE9D
MITADDLDTAVTCVVDALRPTVDQDWSAPAGSLDWTCRATAEHLGQAHLHWASQLAVAAPTQYVRWSATAQELAPPAGVLDFVEAAGRILALVVRATPPETRAYHPWGIGDPEGCTAMACVEALIHGHDLTTTLADPLAPPADLCARILARAFPHEPLPTGNPWLNLRWLTGRTKIPHAPNPDTWRWRPTPLTEPWNRTPEAAPMPFTPLAKPQA